MKHPCTLLPVVDSIEKKCKNQYLLCYLWPTSLLVKERGATIWLR